jgi:hypothetical protein
MGESYFMAVFFHTTRIEFLFDLCENVELKEDARGMQNSQSPKRQKRERESRIEISLCTVRRMFDVL